MTASKKILFVSHSAALYGAERCLTYILEALPGTHFQAVVLVPARGPLTDWMDQRQITYAVIPHLGWYGKSLRMLKGLYRAAFNQIALHRVLEWLKNQSIDLVYSNTTYSILGALIAEKINKPHIWHLHEFIHEDLEMEFDCGKQLGMRLIAEKSDLILCNSNRLVQKYSETVPKSKLECVYNGMPPLTGVSATRKKIDSEQEVCLCVVGRVAPHKRQEDAIRALSVLVHEKNIPARLIVAGNGESDYLKTLKQLAASLRVTDRVEWLGLSSAVSAVYEKSDIALLCSRFEPFGLTILEAMSQGCPVIATRGGGVPEIICDGENGLLFEPGDYKMIAESLVRLVKDPELYQKISDKGIQTVTERFSAAAFSSQVIEKIKEVLTAR